MKKGLLLTIFFFGTFLFAGEECYQITRTKNVYSETPELLCVKQEANNPLTTITLRLGVSNPVQVFATFYMNHLHNGHAYCGDDCNQQFFAMANPVSTTFNALAIKFDGKADSTGVQTGMVYIGNTGFFYKKI